MVMSPTLEVVLEQSKTSCDLDLVELPDTLGRGGEHSCAALAKMEQYRRRAGEDKRQLSGRTVATEPN